MFCCLRVSPKDSGAHVFSRDCVDVGSGGFSAGSWARWVGGRRMACTTQRSKSERGDPHCPARARTCSLPAIAMAFLLDGWFKTDEDDINDLPKDLRDIYVNPWKVQSTHLILLLLEPSTGQRLRASGPIVLYVMVCGKPWFRAVVCAGKVMLREWVMFSLSFFG